MLVAGGATATVVHGVGDLFPDELDFIVGSRKTTRLPDVRLRIRQLTPDDVIPVNGLPTLTVERTIVDLVDLGTDTSLVIDVLSDAVREGTLVNPTQLRSALASLPARLSSDASYVADALDRKLDAPREGAAHG